MVGHHIYTSSWYELGSKTQNPGTFTVELTDGIFGTNTDDVVYNRINPMCAAVPEAMAPLNSGKSMLRVYHPLPDTTIVARSWFVADEITGRGPVPYTFSLIFKGAASDDLLKNPKKAFSPDAMEPYESFCARVTPNAPVALSRTYDPQKEDYMTPFSLSKDAWNAQFGFDRESFVVFFSYLCRAVCSRDDSKIGIILPAGEDSELLILATLSLLPVFMKRKFGAASNWKGLMDGSASKAITGLQLICCCEEPVYSDKKIPIAGDRLLYSDNKFPIIDLTGSGMDENLNINISEQRHAGWVWDNVDKVDALARFEGFMSENFESVLDRMPYQVVEHCFMLWNVFVYLRKPIDFELAPIIIKLIAESFSRNFAKFPFICGCIRDCLSVIKTELAGRSQVDLSVAVIQAICLLANNGEKTAHEILFDIHTYFYKKGDWKKVDVTLSYYAGLLERINITSEMESLCCMVLQEGLASTDPGGVKTAQTAIAKYCTRKRLIALSNRPKNEAEAAAESYIETVFGLFTATGGKLSSSFFQIPELTGTVDIDVAERFFRLAKLDVSRLGHIPTMTQWIETQRWLKPLLREYADRVLELYQLYYSKIPAERKREYILFLEDKLPKQLQTLIQYDKQIRVDIEQVFSECFFEEYRNQIKPESNPSKDSVLSYIGGWIYRLNVFGFTSRDNIFESIRQTLRIDSKKLLEISGEISPDSVRTLAMLYRDTDPRLNRTLEIIRVIDIAATERTITADISPDSIGLDWSETKNYVNRMDYWYNRNIGSPAQWALLMLVAVAGSISFNVESFLVMCRSKMNIAGDDILSEDMVCIFTAMKLLDNYPKGYRERIRDIFKESIPTLMRHTDFPVVFGNPAVASAFAALGPVEWKADLGYNIATKLQQYNDISIEIRELYYRLKYKPVNSRISIDINPKPFIILDALMIVILAASGVLALIFDIKSIIAVVNPVIAFWIPCLLSILVVISSIFTYKSYLSKK